MRAASERKTVDPAELGEHTSWGEKSLSLQDKKGGKTHLAAGGGRDNRKTDSHSIIRGEVQLESYGAGKWLISLTNILAFGFI